MNDDECYASHEPDDVFSDGFKTVTLSSEDIIAKGVTVLAKRERGDDLKWFRGHHSRPVEMTTEERWSGYSEFTITSSWTEVVVRIPEWNWGKRFHSLPSFFAALDEATRGVEI